MKEVAKDLTSLALSKFLSPVEMKAYPEHNTFFASQKGKITRPLTVLSQS